MITWAMSICRASLSHGILTNMKTSVSFVLYVLVLLVLFGTVSDQVAHAADKQAIAINNQYTFFVLPFSFSSNKNQIVVPKTALRNTATSTSVGFTLKTPEGLRQSAGQAVGLVGTGEKPGEYLLYVLYKDTTPSSRVNTLAITHLPFLLVNEKIGTSSQKLNQSEMRHLVVKNPKVLPLTDTE